MTLLPFPTDIIEIHLSNNYRFLYPWTREADFHYTWLTAYLSVMHALGLVSFISPVYFDDIIANTPVIYKLCAESISLYHSEPLHNNLFKDSCCKAENKNAFEIQLLGIHFQCCAATSDNVERRCACCRLGMLAWTDRHESNLASQARIVLQKWVSD